MALEKKGVRGIDTTNEKVNPIEVQSYLKGTHYPAEKQELVDTASRHGANDRIMDKLERIPEGRYASPAQVNKELGRILRGE